METPLKRILNERGIKQSWLAEQVGITNTNLSFIIRGKTDPSLKTAQKIAKVLAVSIEELWPYEE